MTASTPRRAAFDLAAVRRELDATTAGGEPWLEFLRVAHLRVGLYVLAAGATDPQSPHEEDEVYHVMRGRALLSVEGEDLPVGPGSVVYVAAGADHRFHSIREELEVLVFFARRR